MSPERTKDASGLEGRVRSDSAFFYVCIKGIEFKAQFNKEKKMNKAQVGDFVIVHYTGKLDDGTEFA